MTLSLDIRERIRELAAANAKDAYYLTSTLDINSDIQLLLRALDALRWRNLRTEPPAPNKPIIVKSPTGGLDLATFKNGVHLEKLSSDFDCQWLPIPEDN